MSCQNQYCHIVGKNTGRCTAAGCTCLHPLPLEDQLAIKRRIMGIEAENQRLRRLSVLLAEALELAETCLSNGDFGDGSDIIKAHNAVLFALKAAKGEQE